MSRSKATLTVVIVSFFVLCVSGVQFAKSQSTNLININSNGSIDSLSAPIQRNGNVYTFFGNISGSIAVHKSNIVIDGAGYTLQGHGGTGIDLTNDVVQVPSSREIWNVTVRNLRILDFNRSVDTEGGGNHTFINDYIANTTNDVRGGIYFWACNGNNITHCTIIGAPAVYMHFASSHNTITENNLSGDLSLRIGGNELVDRNYWADYLTKYPNASEIDSTGIGSTPYVFNSSGLVGGVLQDNHPLMNPIAILDFPTLPTTSMTTTSPSLSPNYSLSSSPSSSLSSTLSPSSSIPEFPTVTVLLSILTASLLLFAFKKRRH